ncbi:MAG: nickel pincer cofactor biosynthesis protein LarB [Lachnospiraceae bacterium]|jgi:NCAIR mutase (PurE)-related protein|nr:nickel pincer cofactor biosynthesis protein LarB [Lachnospiraceae bacterium]
MDVNAILAGVRSGAMEIKEAEELLKKLPYEDLGYAKIDHHRQVRQGFEEVIYCQGKETEHLVGICRRMAGERINVLGTRASREQAEAVMEVVPEFTYEPVSRLLKAEFRSRELIGKIVICTGGTADIPVAEEAAGAAEFFGTKVTRLFDVGVAGIHRLLSNLEVFEGVNCVIAVAGMEGALPGVVAGLVDVPVIAVPTSVGYGASFGGLSALLTMINSCANGITVVNIDNGYGAGYVATQINRLAVLGHGEKNQ